MAVTSGLETEPSGTWQTDPATLRDVVLDRHAMEARLEICPPLERAWILSLLDRPREAIIEGRKLLDASTDP